jgi:peroxiredoxin
MKAMGRESPIPHAPSALVNLTVLHAARDRSRRHSTETAEGSEDRKALIFQIPAALGPPAHPQILPRSQRLRDRADATEMPTAQPS